MNQSIDPSTLKLKTPKNVQSLIEEFHDLFHPPQSKGSRYAAQLFGIECGDGWYDILKECFTKIQKINAKLKPSDTHLNSEFYDGPTYIHQVKEKFGGLRVYLSWQTEAHDQAIDEAVEKSFKTCEDCGGPGEMREKNRWYYVRCDDCWNELQSAKSCSW